MAVICGAIFALVLTSGCRIEWGEEGEGGDLAAAITEGLSMNDGVFIPDGEVDPAASPTPTPIPTPTPAPTP